MVGMWLGEICSCSCLTDLPGSAWVLVHRNTNLFHKSVEYVVIPRIDEGGARAEGVKEERTECALGLYIHRSRKLLIYAEKKRLVWCAGWLLMSAIGVTFPKLCHPILSSSLYSSYLTALRGLPTHDTSLVICLPCFPLPLGHKTCALNNTIFVRPGVLQS